MLSVRGMHQQFPCDVPYISTRLSSAVIQTLSQCLHKFLQTVLQCFCICCASFCTLLLLLADVPCYHWCQRHGGGEAHWGQRLVGSVGNGKGSDLRASRPCSSEMQDVEQLNSSQSSSQSAVTGEIRREGPLICHRRTVPKPSLTAMPCSP